MSANEPKVSVCIPTYKGGRPLAAAIESVLAQTLTDFELIVIDDGSPDDTRDVVARFRDRRLVYLRNESNLGAERNWNRCLEVARGEYFKLLPHDDMLHRRCLERQSAVLDADLGERIALVFSARDVLGPHGKVLVQRGYPGGREGAIDASAVIAACVRRGTNLLGEPGAVLMRKRLADRVGKFDATYPYVTDLDYWFRLLAHGDAHYCADKLAAFRVSATQWSVAIGVRQSEDFRRFVERYAEKGALKIGRLDRLMSAVMAKLNNLARLAFYHVYLR